MEYGESFAGAYSNSEEINMPVFNSKDDYKELIKQIATTPDKFKSTQSERFKNCKHSWRRFPMWCHYRDSVSRSYCLYCPTVGIFNRFGDVQHHPINIEAYKILLSKTSWD